MLAVMWLSEVVDQSSPADLDYYGIRPRSLNGLLGIPLAPFLHGSFAHLVANAGAFLVLGLTIAYTTRRFWTVTVWVTLLGGLGVWLFAPPGTVTIGASGLVYGYGAFLVAWGLFTRRLLAIVVSVAVILLYGGLVWGVLPTNPMVSWQGHLFGAAAGVVTAWRLSRHRRR
jgi:membrane associated rhomboid family serine protease